MAKAKAASAEAIDDEETEAGARKPARRVMGLPLNGVAVALGALLVVGGGVGGYVAWTAPGEPKEAVQESEKPVPPPVFVDLPDILVNLSATGGERPQYLRLKIVLELPTQDMIQQVQPVMPRVIDAFQTFLRELRPTDLEGSAGLYRMREELTRRVNIAVAPSRINAVLFKEIVVQ